jgi:hypothetical protein
MVIKIYDEFYKLFKDQNNLINSNGSGSGSGSGFPSNATLFEYLFSILFNYRYMFRSYCHLQAPDLAHATGCKQPSLIAMKPEMARIYRKDG